jgi:hypothetical protein
MHKITVAISPIQFIQTGKEHSPMITEIPVTILSKCNMATIPKIVPAMRSQKVVEFIAL